MSCISHQGRYDDNDNPLTDSGELFMPGVRSCGHRDCVNKNHLAGNRDYESKVNAEVLEIGQRPFSGATTCLVTGCTRVHKSRHLCQNHYELLARLKPSVIKKHEHLTLADFPERLEPHKQGRMTKEVLICILPNCEKPNYIRGLCVSHHKQYYRLKKEAS